jgi:hypothetical protein
MDSARLQPALYGGLLIGVLSALPIVNWGNCCCCLWVVAGGMLAVHLRQQNSAFAITSAQGALVGLLAGLFGGILGVVLSIPIDMAMGPYQRQLLEWAVAQNPDIPSETREMIERAGRGSGGVAGVVFNFVAYSFFGSIFGMLGGLLGVALFSKNVPPPPPPTPPVGTFDVLPPEG